MNEELNLVAVSLADCHALSGPGSELKKGSMESTWIEAV